MKAFFLFLALLVAPVVAHAQAVPGPGVLPCVPNDARTGCGSGGGGGGSTPGSPVNSAQFNANGILAGNAGYTIVAAAVCNGTTDDGPAINTAISNAAANGGGTVMIPQGTCGIGTSIVMMSGVTLKGASLGGTMLEGLSTFANTFPMIVTQNFSSLVGSGSNGGPNRFAIEDMTINGNYQARGANAGGGGNDISIYGFRFVIKEVQLEYAPADGIHSLWAPNALGTIGSNNNFGMESTVEDVTAEENQNVGIHFEGPHDSYIINTRVFRSGSRGYEFDDTATSQASGSWLVLAHAYNNCLTAACQGVYINLSTIFGDTIESENNKQFSATRGLDIENGGALWASSVSVWGNSGVGLYITNPSSGSILGTQLVNVVSYSNGADGIDINQNGSPTIPIKLTGVNVSSNTGVGLNACAFATTNNGGELMVTDLMAYKNTSHGVENCGGASQFWNLQLRANGGWGFFTPATVTSNSFIFASGWATANTTGDWTFGTISNSNINVGGNTASGQTCQSGTYSDSNVVIACYGAGTINSVNMVSFTGMPTTAPSGQCQLWQNAGVLTWTNCGS